MTALLRIHDPDHGCRDCGNTGSILDEDTHTYGAWRRVRCHCVPVVIDTTPRPSKDDMMDAAIADMGLTPAEYWAGVAFVAVGTLVVTVAAQWFLDTAVGVV